MACLGLDATGGGPFGIASPSMFQFVAQVYPLSTVIGKPLVQRKTPETFQPPSTAFSTGFELPINRWPLPKGSWYTRFALIWWKALKSESPRNESGSHELMTMPPPFKSFPVPPVPSYGPMRSAADAWSNDFDHV